MQKIEPAHVYARLHLVLSELELLRRALGRGRDERPAPKVTGAQPREVYFAALALAQRAERLAAEHGAGAGALPAAAAVPQLTPGHVHGVVDVVVDRLAQVRGRLGVPGAGVEPAVEPARRPSDCMSAAIAASRQLDRLLERPTSPSDVDRTLGVIAGVVAGLCAHAGVDAPALPAFEPDHRPGDVLARLGTSLSLAREIAVAAGHTAVELGAEPADAVPGDCFDTAAVLLGVVSFLHAAIPSLGVPLPLLPCDPGRRLPSHCFQRAGQIERGLRAVAAAVARRPELVRGQQG